MDRQTDKYLLTLRAALPPFLSAGPLAPSRVQSGWSPRVRIRVRLRKVCEQVSLENSVQLNSI